MTNRTRKRKQVVIACVSCRQSKTACDEERPCKRCVAKGICDTCVDAPKKKRMTKKEKLLAESLNPPVPKIAKNKRRTKKSQTKVQVDDSSGLGYSPGPQTVVNQQEPNHHYQPYFQSYTQPKSQPPQTYPSTVPHCVTPYQMSEPNFQHISTENMLDSTFLEPAPIELLNGARNDYSSAQDAIVPDFGFLPFPIVNEPESFEPHSNNFSRITDSSSTDLLCDAFFNNTPSVESLVHHLANDYDMHVHYHPQVVE